MSLILNRDEKRVNNRADIVIKKIENAEKNHKQIQNWMDEISALHNKSGISPVVTPTKKMPDMESLMKEWPEAMENILKVMEFPDERLKLGLEDYCRLACNLIDIPVHKLQNKRAVIESLHMFFSLYQVIVENFKKKDEENTAGPKVEKMKFT